MTSGPRRPGAADATTAQLRDDIDHGRTGDKVDHPDPAVAPLGTDDEAAGTPAPAAVVGKERELAAAERQPAQSRRRTPAMMPVILVAVLIVLGMVVWAA